MAETTVVKFGTDGWRGIIADDFTYANVRVAAAAIANYVLAHENPAAGVCIGYDTRFGSRSFAKVVAEGACRCGHSGGYGRGDYADACAFVCGARAEGGGWGDDYVEPQSCGVERGEVQGELWWIGEAVDHDGDRRAIWVKPLPKQRDAGSD